MSECHLCLLGLIALSSLLTGISGENETHVFIRSGKNVRLPCNNALHNCNSTTWLYNGFNHSAAVELINLGIKKEDIKRQERLSLGSDCSLNIRNISTEDYGSYTCQQWTGEKRDQKQGNDTRVYLHVLHASSSQTQISSDLSVTLSCRLYSYPRVSCDYSGRSERINLFWVNQAAIKLNISDSRYQRSSSSDPCFISLTTTLLNEDHNREWRCNVTQKDQVKTSVTFTVKRTDKPATAVPDSLETTAPAKTTTAVINSTAGPDSQDLSTTNTQKTTAPGETTTAVINSQDTTAILISAVAAAAVFLTAVLWLICRKRAGNKRGTGETAVKDENEDKVTYETINMSTPAAARDNEQTDDVTYSEVSSSSKKPVKSVKDQDDSVTYAAIRGTQNEPLGELYASVNKNK
nr:diverse immunoglobulin domain-containing protein DICP-A+-5 [Carassius gibelio]